MGNILVSCQSEFTPPLKLRTRRLNVLEVHGITASVKFHRWTNNNNNNNKLISRWQMTVDLIFSLSLVSLNNKIARVDSTFCVISTTKTANNQDASNESPNLYYKRYFARNFYAVLKL